MLGNSSRVLCWKNIWSLYTCLKAVLLYFSSTPRPKLRHLFPLRYLKLDLTVKWVIGGILRRYFSCLHPAKPFSPPIASERSHSISHYLCHTCHDRGGRFTTFFHSSLRHRVILFILLIKRADRQESRSSFLSRCTI